jgi:hypothetical protein
MWHCSIEHILAAVRAGTLPSRIEGQFLLVPVDLPEGPPVKPRHHVTLDPPSSRRESPDWRREEIVTPQEMAALVGAGQDEPSAAEDQSCMEVEQQDNQESAEAPLDISQWRIIRRRTSLLRRPPRKTAAAVSAP